ncbi:MAG: lmo0937 family membrane protein [Acidobacteria bacterium]|nr:MAG: lmo0937 family membrane protein [Acidobacteriota bacterium]
MLSTLLIVLLILWLLGTVSSYTMGGFIHILLVVALVLFVVRMLQGRRLAG